MAKRIDNPDNYVSAKEFIEIIARESDYHIYEVRDIYGTMLRVLETLVLHQKDFNVGELFSIRYVDSKIREFVLPGTGGKTRMSVGGKRIKVKASKTLNARVRDISTGKRTVNEVLGFSDDEPPEDTPKSDSFE